MILLTVGTEQFPFDRLVRAFDELFATTLRGQIGYAQIGTASYTPRNVEYERVMPYPQLQSLIANADVVVSHAGAGSLLTIERHKKACLVVPRLQRYGEHVDNHQLDIAQRFSRAGRIHLVSDLADLGEQLRTVGASVRNEPDVCRTDFGLVDRMESIMQGVQCVTEDA